MPADPAPCIGRRSSATTKGRRQSMSRADHRGEDVVATGETVG
jgi:hypothetical protein